MQRIYLIPGFFGFANFGDLKYFAHVRDRLGATMSARGIEVEMHYVQTLPTASLRRRAARVVETIADTAGDGDAIHLVGHSTGGIDARLVVSPGVNLPTSHPVDAIASRVRTIVAVASPHLGAPQAATFNSMFGQALLKSLSLLTVHTIRLGSAPLPALLGLAAALPRTGKVDGPLGRTISQIYHQLLKDFDRERQDKLQSFFAESADDQTLLPQLSPEGMDLFNAAVTRRSETRYGCVVMQARPPQSATSIGLSPTAQATHTLYRTLHRLAASLPRHLVPAFAPEQEESLRAAFGHVPEPEANDAIVPVVSQVFGDVVHAAWGDHLDVIGHYGDRDVLPPHVDWLTTGSNFDEVRFARLWEDVGAYLVPA